MTPEQRAELRKAAEEATPGPWSIGAPPPNGEQTIGTLFGLMVCVATTGYGIQTKANARHIAAANPATILQLLDYVESLEKQRDELLLYKNLANEYGLSVFEDIAELKRQRDELLAALDLYEQALQASWPEGATGDAFDYWNSARTAAEIGKESK